MWSLDVSQPSGPSRPVTGTALPFYHTRGPKAKSRIFESEFTDHTDFVVRYSVTNTTEQHFVLFSRELSEVQSYIKLIAVFYAPNFYFVIYVHETQRQPYCDTSSRPQVGLEVDPLHWKHKTGNRI
jgi:hypothetical protein